jgi:16S rRNA processing protein RimM
MPRQQETEWATIGTIVAPFGVRGEMKVFSLTDIPDRFQKLRNVYLKPDYKSYTLEGVRLAPGSAGLLLLKLRGIDDATTVEGLRKRDICIPLSQIANLPPDTYYQHDLLGLRVVTLEGQEVGTLFRIMETGSNDVYEIQPPEGKLILIPAIKQVIKKVDLTSRTMFIDPMPGLLDDQAVLIDPAGLVEEEGTAEE